MKKLPRILLLLFFAFISFGLAGYIVWNQFALTVDKSTEDNINEQIYSQTDDVFEATTTPSQTQSKVETKKGTFNQIDFQHKGSGDVELIQENNLYYIVFKDNFQVSNGPDLYIYLSSEQEFKNQAVNGLDTAKTINIGKLEKLSGEQKYQISQNAFENYNSAVVIWCKAFGVQFSRADLN